MSDLLWLLAVPLALALEWAIGELERQASMPVAWRDYIPEDPPFMRHPSERPAAKRDARLAEAVGRAQRDAGFYQANITNHARLAGVTMEQANRAMTAHARATGWRIGKRSV